jgi:hypothetical protein
MDGAKTEGLNIAKGGSSVILLWVEEREEIMEDLNWFRLDISLVQILVVVVIIDVRSI